MRCGLGAPQHSFSGNRYAYWILQGQEVNFTAVVGWQAVDWLLRHRYQFHEPWVVMVSSPISNDTHQSAEVRVSIAIVLTGCVCRTQLNTQLSVALSYVVA